MLTDVAAIITQNIDEIARRWVAALRRSSRTQVHNSMLSAEIVDGLKGMLANLAQTIAQRDAPDRFTLPLLIISGTDGSETPASSAPLLDSPERLGTPFTRALREAATHGKKRQLQGYSYHEAAIEYVFLRQIMWGVLGVQAPEQGFSLPIELVQYVDRLLDELMLHSLDNFYSASVHDLEKRAIRDLSTQLYNKEYFHQRLSEEVRRAARYTQPLTVAMIDLDGLKQINDTYGHPAGDAVLLAVAEAIKNSVRQPDVPCRYGGDEFAVILTETNKSQARMMAERLLEAVRDSTVVISHGTKAGAEGSEKATPAQQGSAEGTDSPLTVVLPTVSIGLAAYPEDARNPELLVAKADATLYQAKRAGRNRIFAMENRSPGRGSP